MIGQRESNSIIVENTNKNSNFETILQYFDVTAKVKGIFILPRETQISNSKCIKYIIYSFHLMSYPQIIMAIIFNKGYFSSYLMETIALLKFNFQLDCKTGNEI